MCQYASVPCHIALHIMAIQSIFVLIPHALFSAMVFYCLTHVTKNDWERDRDGKWQNKLYSMNPFETHSINKNYFFVSLHYAIKIAASEYVGSYFVYSIKCFALESRTYILLHLYTHVHVPRLVRLHVYIEFKLCMNFIRCAHFETIVLLCTEITRFQIWTFLTM